MPEELTDVANYLFGLTSEAQHANATDCEHCGARAVMFNPGNVAVMCHACGIPVGPERQEERLRHLLTYVRGAAAQIGSPSRLRAPWSPGPTPPSDQVAHEIHQTLRPGEGEDDPVGPDAALRRELARAANGRENRTDTPDFVMGDFMADVLRAYERAVLARERFGGGGG